jgi:hypothetical protein
MNRNKRCELPALPLCIVPANNWSVLWKEQKRRFSYLPSAEQAIADLNDLSRQGEGVPASIHKSTSGKEELRLYCSDYYLGLYSNQYEDGYVLSHIRPIDLGAHDILADGVLWLQKGWYQLYYRLPDIPRGSTNCKAQIWQAWASLEQEKQQRRSNGQVQESVTLAQKHYLNTILSLIDITSQLEQEKYKLSSMIPYLAFTATDERRSGLHDIYEFRLYQPVQIWPERHRLRVMDVPDLYGKILSLTGTHLKIKFETKVDRIRIPPQGNIEILPGTSIFDVQRRAVKMFREGTAKNAHLLGALVNHCYQPYQVAKQQPEGLNNEQQAAFQHALTVPDLLLVLGPPGTGKTHTITEIIRHHCTYNKKHVLVASHTHKAVDNVLSRLPSSIEVVRLGHEDRVAEDTRHLLPDVKVKKMQEDILRCTELLSAGLACFLDESQEIIDWQHDLHQLAEHLDQLEQQQQDLQERKNAVIRRIQNPFQENLATNTQLLQTYEYRLASLIKKRTRWQALWVKHASRAHFFVLGWFFVWRSQKSHSHLFQIQRLYEATHDLLATLKAANTDLQVQIQRLLWADPEYRTIEDTIAEREQAVVDMRQRITRSAGLLHGTIERVSQTIPLPKLTTGAAIRHYLTWYEQQYSHFVRSAALMHDWRKQLAERSTQLQREIIRYADVVGATCIGVALAEGLEETDIDLAVIDEAGQIGITDLLVPLAHAHRAVLVGDHQQLPPFVENEVHEWLESLGAQEEDIAYGMDNQAIRKHLTSSAFELLFTEAERNQRLIRLTHQFRMPQVIADFAAQHFYENQLYTVHPEKLANACRRASLLRSPLVVVDTTTLAQAGHREERQLKKEQWGKEGYCNEIEAYVIASLVAYYEQINTQWVVIVPYRMQAQYIIDLLQTQFQITTYGWEERISTVDSFQGSESEKVIYGFTRSNLHGHIGFLTELRRLNVALTRAKEQLVVVGDFSTLKRATHLPFQRLARALYQHAQQYGEVLSYEECMQRLVTSKGQE